MNLSIPVSSQHYLLEQSLPTTPYSTTLATNREMQDSTCVSEYPKTTALRAYAYEERYRNDDVTWKYIGSRATMASSLSMRDSRGCQNLELPSQDGPPLIKSPDHEGRQPGQAPVQRGPRHLSTASELMKDPPAGRNAPSATVQSESHHKSRVVTRLTNPMQLHKKLEVIRKRGQTPDPSLPLPQDAEKSGLDSSAAETPPVEASFNGLWAFEKGAGKQLFEVNGYEDSELPSKLSEQNMDSDLYESAQLFAIDAVGEFNTPYSAFVPSLWSSSTTSQRTTSGTWSAISQSSTMLDQSLIASPRYSESIEYITQQPTINKGYWVSPGSGSLLGPAFSPDGCDSLVDISSSPEELLSAPGLHGPWYSGFPLNSQQGNLQSTHANAVQYSHYAEGYIDQVEDPGQTSSWKNPALFDLQYCPIPAAVSSEIISPMSSAPISEDSDQNQLIGQPNSDASLMVSELDGSIIVEQSPAVIALSSLSARKSHPSFNLAGTRKSMEKPPPKAKRAKSGPRKSRRVDAAADVKDDTFRCSFPNCTHQSTGVHKNRRGHLERHMRTHGSERLFCPVPGCKRDFPIDRNDNLTAHCLRVHRTKC